MQNEIVNPVDIWQCEECTYVNKPHTKCISCGVSNPDSNYDNFFNCRKCDQLNSIENTYCVFCDTYKNDNVENIVKLINDKNKKNIEEQIDEKINNIIKNKDDEKQNIYLSNAYFKKYIIVIIVILLWINMLYVPIKYKNYVRILTSEICVIVFNDFVEIHNIISTAMHIFKILFESIVITICLMCFVSHIYYTNQFLEHIIDNIVS